MHGKLNWLLLKDVLQTISNRIRFHIAVVLLNDGALYSEFEDRPHRNKKKKH